MLTTLLVGYYLHQFTVPAPSVHRQDLSKQYIRSVHPAGNLTVETHSPRSGSVAPGSQRLEMLRLRITADCSADVPIQTISVQRRGLGANADIQSLHVSHRGSRISRERDITNKDGSVDLQLRNFTITACDSEDILVLANYSPDASPAGEHRIELRNVDAGKSQVRIDHTAGNFAPLQRTASRTVGQIGLEYLRLTKPVRYGSKQLLSRFTLGADGVNNHNVTQITLTNNGSATNEDLQNLYIEFRSRRISSYARTLKRDKAVFTFDPPIRLNKNQTLKFGLRADVRASRSRTIQFIVEEPSDIISSPIRRR
jgi:hypothetical protein